MTASTTAAIGTNPSAAASSLLPYTRSRRGSNVNQLPMAPELNSAPTKLAPIRNAANARKYDDPCNRSGMISAKIACGLPKSSSRGSG